MQLLLLGALLVLEVLTSKSNTLGLDSSISLVPQRARFTVVQVHLRLYIDR